MITKSVDAIVIVLVLMMASVTAYSQKTDFMTPDFNSAHSWQQERDNFITDSDGFISDTSHTYDTDVISRGIDGLLPENGDISLNFTVRCNYDNSSVNNFHIYIIANGNDPMDPDFRGFAVGTGHKPNYKTYSLIYNHGGNISVLANTDITITKKNPTLHVVRTSGGQWLINGNAVYTEPPARFHLSNTLVTTFSFNRTGAGNFGIRFNEFEQSIKPNHQKSHLDSAAIISRNVVRIFNNARLYASTAENRNNYSLNGKHPQKVDYRFYYTDLYFDDGCLSSGAELKLVAAGIRDFAGMDVEPFAQTFYQAGREDVVINEIMVDLSPAPFALPKNKYVELLNTSGRSLRLDGYTFCIGDLEYQLPDINFPPEGFLILCANDTAFARYGKCAGILQESRLTVSDKVLMLRNKIAGLVDSVAYSQKLYNDPTRQDGGYSMERRDPLNSCSGNANWHASTDLSGGTPGRQNSQYQVYVDTSIPEVMQCVAISPGKFSVEFSEPVAEAIFSLNGIAPNEVSISGGSALVTFPKPMRRGINELSASATDLCRTVGPVCAISLEYTPFAVESLHAISPYQLIITFSGDVGDVSTENFILSDGQMPFLCEYTSDGRRNLMLSFADDFVSDRKYSLSISHLCNAMGECIDGQSISFRHHALQPGDLLINELMYYPNVGEKRYVEIYNNSGGDVFLYGLMLRHHSAALDVHREAMVQSHGILPDGGYAVVAADTASVSSVYGADADKMAHCPGLPALNTGKGYVVLLSAAGQQLDSVYYEKSMHSSILQSVRGVALERVSPDAASMDPGNWQSAQAEFNYATPGRRNSVAVDYGYEGEHQDPEDGQGGEEVAVENRLICPGNMDRAMCISLNFARRDVCVSASVYDDNGRPMRNLVTQEMAYQGYRLLWDGISDHGSICRVGIYVVVIKVWDPTGWSKTYKLPCVVGTGR